MNAILLNRAFRVLVLAAWSQRTVVRCEYHGEQQIGDGRGGHHEDGHHQDHHVRPLYKFGYWVHDPKTNDVKNHWEHRDGDVVHGSYSLMQPDGHVRVVDYTVDKHSGFNAHVRYVYEGRAGGDAAESGDESVGRSGDAPATGRPRAGHARPSPYGSYKKPRRGDRQSAGRYRGPYRSDYTEPRSPGRSAGRHRQPDGRGRFDRLPALFPSARGAGDAFDGVRVDVDDRPSDRFARKYSSAAAAAADQSSYYTGVRHRTELLHRRPDVASAASTERRYRGTPAEEPRPSPTPHGDHHVDHADHHVDHGDHHVDHADRPTQQFRRGLDGSPPPYPFEMPENPPATYVDDAPRTFASPYFPGTVAEDDDDYSTGQDSD